MYGPRSSKAVSRPCYWSSATPVVWRDGKSGDVAKRKIGTAR